MMPKECTLTDTCNVKVFRTNNTFMLDPLEDKAALAAMKAYEEALDKDEPQGLKKVMQEFLSNVQKLKELEELFKQNGYTPERVKEIERLNNAVALEELLENLKCEQQKAPIYKVIMTDNYNRELYDDKLIMESIILSEAEALAKDLNSKQHHNSDWWHVVVPNSYELFVFEP